ncbi:MULTISPECIES: hypothetical protein [unclassified Rhizobium]|uniref:hypothetical protein n=1 Tax=unclassified Rhizobium TaxID=2613769 RepID=UPI000EA87D32|nr:MULTISPECIES: hypothetical protein [unclassified Rhizobium]AYG69642.1 hypothetical protein CCGE531_25425 [Rhizobium sp. CCGE531]AYG76020.1 hypothetical protein CCGE532_24940 [Rhizobium sp. CCGE532]
MVLLNRDVTPEIEAVRALIDRQFRSVSWGPDGVPDWTAFIADFVSQAPLYASARPIHPQSIQQFAERMNGLVGTSLESFHERALESVVHAFGNVAVDVVVCENIENAAETNRTVEMMLLVKDKGVWRIAAQAWDKESASDPVTGQILQAARQTNTAF